jgi:hypothetical protein
MGLSSPTFWRDVSNAYGVLQHDGSLQYVLLDYKYKMRPLVRNVKSTFTQFLASDVHAKACKVIVNGTLYSLTNSGKFSVMLGRPDDPSDTTTQGLMVENGKVVAGDSRPKSFWFGQVINPNPSPAPAASKPGRKSAKKGPAKPDPWPWTYKVGNGDPPLTPSTLGAIGGVAPLIINTLPYGTENRYKSGAPPKAIKPSTGEPSPEARPYLIQRSNATFTDVNNRPPATGKTILAYCSAKRTILIAVQPDGAGPGETHASITAALAQQGFDAAVFLDGSDSATLVLDGKVVVAPGDRKNETIDVGVGFWV